MMITSRNQSKPGEVTVIAAKTTKDLAETDNCENN